jgi:uncharacterized zinc-type alcohol dehydrogenase-like protein
MIKSFAVLEAGGELKPYEYDPGELGRDEVEIDVEHCGICHSDISMIDNAWGMAQYPLVPGHEVIGTVAKKGAGVTNTSVGDKVGLGWQSGFCMTCPSCLSGDHNLCASSQATIVGRHGGFAEQVRAQATSVVPLPAGMDIQSAGPLFCGGVTVFNPMIQYDLKPTSKVAVIGIGGLGHMALQFLRAWGCEVTAFTSTDSKREEALTMGAHHTINSRDPEAIAAAAGRFDMVISTVNVKLDWNAFVATLSPRGRLHFVGATVEPLDIGVFPLLMAQRSVSASPIGSPATIAQMLEFCVRHDIKPVIETFSFDQVNEAMARLRSGEARYRIVLSW